MQEINNARQESSAERVLKVIRSKAAGNPPVLVVLCGPSHAGKTAFARAVCENFTIISSDEIRKRLCVAFGDSKHESKIWGIYDSMKREALKKGCNVVLDACHVSERARWHSLQGPNGSHGKICVVFDLPWRTIRARCLREKRVLKEVKRMWTGFQKSRPTEGELKRKGFDEVYFVGE
jgi:predicted kinase